VARLPARALTADAQPAVVPVTLIGCCPPQHVVGLLDRCREAPVWGQYVIGVDDNDIGVRGEIATPRVVLLAVADDEASSVDIHVDRRPFASVEVRVIDGRRGVAVACRDRHPECGDQRSPGIGQRA